MSKIKDNSLVDEGLSSIQWAKDNMPILSRIRKEFEKEKPFLGIRIGVSMHLDSKTAVFRIGNYIVDVFRRGRIEKTTRNTYSVVALLRRKTRNTKSVNLEIVSL